MNKLLILGDTIVKVLIRSKLLGDARDNFTDIFSMLEGFGIDAFEARDLNRCFEKIGDNIVASCNKILEYSEVDEERQEVIVQHLIKSYSKLSLNITTLLNMGANVDVLKRNLLEANQEYKKDLDIKESEMYERLIEHTSNLILNSYINLPEFNQEGIKRLNQQSDEIIEKINELIEQVDKVNSLVIDKTTKTSNFERYYRNSIITHNNYVHLFGAGGIESEYKLYQLSIAYVELEMKDVDSGRDVKLNRIFDNSKNIWLSGDAGLGKTTILQWIAVKSAECNADVFGLRDTIPLFIELRKYNSENISLIECVKKVMKDSSYEIPEGWIEESIDKGRLIFLFDGFDEISQAERINVLHWINQIDAMNRCKKIYTARPQVKERPFTNNFSEIKILPMNHIRIRKFIQYWHRAVLSEQLKLDKKEAEIIATEITEKIKISDSLSKLASIPLLCAMICALHHRNERNIPSNKRELYEECCKMLLEKRDSEKSLKIMPIKLSYEQKKIILSRLAYWMMRNDNVIVNKKEAEEYVERTINVMNVSTGNIDNKIVFSYLLERSGLLREPENNKIDFIHKTFQEYLAAYDISREQDWGLLETKIGDAEWQETIGISIGFANENIANKIIKETLNKGKDECDKKKFLFTSISYLNGAVEVDKEIRDEIQNKISVLIPPEYDECQGIAEVGDLAVQYLISKKNYSCEQRIACLNVLMTIGTVKALKISTTYFDRILSYEELNELGALYSKFTERELIENCIHLYLKDYILKICKDKVVLHEIMMSILNLLEKSEINELNKKGVKRLEIIDFGEDERLETTSIFKEIDSLHISGDFEEISILQCFENLNTLVVCNQNSTFSIDNLNQFTNIYSIKNFSIVSSAREYIVGRDLDFLKNCKNISILLMNRMSELYINDFRKLNKLTRLRIGGEYAIDDDFSYFDDCIFHLIVAIPENEYKSTKRQIKMSLETNISKISIQKLEPILKDFRYVY